MAYLPITTWELVGKLVQEFSFPNLFGVVAIGVFNLEKSNGLGVLRLKPFFTGCVGKLAEKTDIVGCSFDSLLGLRAHSFDLLV